MKMFTSILVPLDGSRTAAKSLGCAAWLASRLGARLRISSAASRSPPAPEELRRLHVPEELWPMVELDQSPLAPAEAILAALDVRGAGLVVMTARGSSVEAVTSSPADLTKIVGHVTRAVIQRSRAPVLLLPTGYEEKLPWQRLLVPVSGGTESDRALALSVCLADALELTVYAAHVTDDGAGDEDLAGRARYTDQLHHEYAGQLEELVTRALPALSADQCRRLRGIALGRGPVAGELLQLVRREAISALVLGWHGQLATGRAEVLKHLLPVLEVPVLLVRSEAPTPFRLEVGEELGGAP